VEAEMNINDRLRRSEATCEFLRNLANALFRDLFDRDIVQHGQIVEMLKNMEVFSDLNNDSAIQIAPFVDLEGFDENDFTF
tara:strand:- start:775 stop:1017 length:243 start_codon:yes stop_codon:yes gene_type:complete